jgi:hypothetical protein
LAVLKALRQGGEAPDAKLHANHLMKTPLDEQFAAQRWEK